MSRIRNCNKIHRNLDVAAVLAKIAYYLRPFIEWVWSFAA
jgi:hypothetical protein